MESLEPWYRTFREVDVVKSNHDARPYKKLFAAQLPVQLAKGMAEFLKSPKGWTWLQGGIEIDGVWYYHGERLTQANWRLAHEKFKMSVVHGHLHSGAGVVYHQDRNRRYFVMNTGCLIDEPAYCFRYNEDNYNKAVISCGVVIDGETAILETMPLKWLK